MTRPLVSTLLALLALGCGTRATSTAVTPPEPDPAETTAAKVPARDTFHVSGQVRGHDGSALKKAELLVFRDGFMKPVLRIDLDAEGRFEVELPRHKLYRVSIAAVDHAQHYTSFWLSDDVRVEGRLGTYPLVEAADTVGIRSEYLDADGKRVGEGPKLAHRGSAQNYTLTLAEKPVGATVLRYQLGAPGRGRTFNGPTADRFESDGGGDYWSVVDIAERGAITLDLSQLPPSGKGSQLQWTGLDPVIATVQKWQQAWEQQLAVIDEKALRDDPKQYVMTDALRDEARALADAASRDIDAVEDPRTRSLLRAQHAGSFLGYLHDVDDPAALGPSLLSAVEAVEPTDPALAVVMNFDNRLYRLMQAGDAKAIAAIEPWLMRRATDNPSPTAASGALELLIGHAEQERDFDRAAELYAISDRPQYEDTYQRQFLAERYDPMRTLRPGGKLPAYAFVGLTDKAASVRSDDRDRLYLLEFWATWCGPCINEQPKLHEAYATVNGLGVSLPPKKLRRLKPPKSPKVEFLFVSLDASPDDVAKFRREYWSMPWTHAFVGREGEDALMDEFGFHAVPTAGAGRRRRHDRRDGRTATR